MVCPIPVNYRFIVHTHSHIALLGWVYLALTTLLYHLFLNRDELQRRYRRIFWFTQICLLGMLLSFPFQGYALFSIVFSTLFLLASYWFSAFFIKNAPNSIKNTKAYTCVKASLWFMIGSSLGPWALGAIMTVLGPESIWYRLAIYFYLHFQYNGWMMLALAGLLFYILEQQQIIVSHRTFRNFFLTHGYRNCIELFSVYPLDRTSIDILYFGRFGGFLQLIGFGILIEDLL